MSDNDSWFTFGQLLAMLGMFVYVAVIALIALVVFAWFTK